MFRSWIRKLFSPGRTSTIRVRSHKPRARSTRPRLGFDSLEVRDVPAFLMPMTSATGLNPAGIGVGDFNGDGKDDMAVVSQTSPGSIGIFLSNGDGSFGPRVDYSTQNFASDATAADLNGDGKLDLAVSGGGFMDIFVGNGDGTFQPATQYAAGGGTSVKAGDFNNDGKLDLGTIATGSASVLLNNGDGTFQPSRNILMPGGATTAVVGDFDNDGNLDMATSNTNSIGTITLLYGHGDGSFDPAANVYAYSAPVYVASGDFNHDGNDDFAVANSYAATSMSIILGHGGRTYDAPVTYNIPQTGYEIEVEDFDNDGNDDYAVRGGSSYMIGYGKGDGTFFTPVSFATTSGRFEAGTHGDFNGDGSVDLAYPSTSGVTVVMNANDSVSNLAGATSFQISAPATATAGSSFPITVSAVDVDGNIASGYRGTVYLTSNDPGSRSTFAYTFTASDAGTHTFTGNVKLVTLGDQTVTAASSFLPAATATVTVTPAVSQFGVSLPASTTAGGTFDVTVTALNSIGGVGTEYGGTVHFSSSDTQAGLPSDYTFTSADAGVHTFQVTMKTAGTKFVNVNEVGGVVRGGANLNVTPAAAAGFTLAGAGGAIGVARPITIVASDAFGNMQTGYNGTVHFTSSDANAVLPSDTALVNGVATVNVTFLTVGTQTVTATGVADANLTGTMSSNATPPVAAQFAVTSALSTTAGAATNFTVTVRDTIGQVATGFTGTVYFSSSDIQAGLPASYTFTAADAGVHTFSATLRTAGPQSITVRDLSGLLTGSIAGISVTPAAFAGYRLSVPNPSDSKGHILVTAGESISLTVRATDAFGNTVTGYKGKVKFTSTDVQAGLPTAYSFTAADAGVHTFTVSLKTATPNGVVYSFTATDASLATAVATITNFEVMNAAAAKFVLSVPSNITAGTPYSVRVVVLDAYGNKVKNYFGTIHFGSTAGALGLPADYTYNSDDAGDHTFTVTSNTTGNQVLSVNDTINTALSASVTISPKAGSTTTTTGGGGGSGGGGGKGGKTV